MNKKELLYKIIHDELTPEEEKKLMNHSPVLTVCIAIGIKRSV